MTELALKKIAENKARHARGEDASMLDLGRCGLTEIPDLSDMHWVKKLLLANRWRNWDGIIISSENSGNENKIENIEKGKFPENITELIFGGDMFPIWSVSDISPIGELASLEKLTLRGCSIDNISSLIHLDNLRELDLGVNQISNETAKLAFSALNNLEKLNIEYNLITDISIFSNLKKLKFLNLRNEYFITDISAISSLKNLRELILYYHGTVDLSPLQHLINLEKLALRMISTDDTPVKKQSRSGNRTNGYTDISPLSSLQNLTELSFNNHHVRDIYPLGNLSNLQKLTFTGNHFVKDFSPISKLTNLRFLKLSGNGYMKNIQFIENLVKLEQLNLEGNPLLNKIEALKGLYNLKSIEIFQSEITDITPLGELNSLEHLKLQAGELSDISIIGELSNLKVLSLFGNKVTDISPLSKLKNIENIDLSDNDIRDVKPLIGLLKLGFKIVLQMQLAKVNNKRINVSSQIQVGAQRHFKITKGARTISIDSNPLDSPPVEIVMQGSDSIIKYFEDLDKQGQDQIYEAKLILIGEGGAGKTSLCRKLLDPEATLPEEKERTRGIDIHSLYFDVPEKTEKQFRLNIWDFAGQGKYQSAHSFFYTHRSLYLLVDDTRTLNEHDSCRTLYNNWLQTAELYGGGSPLIVLHNQKADCIRKGFSLGSFLERFPFVHGEFFQINLGRNNSDKIIELKKQIERLASNLPHIGDTVPKNWVSVRESVEEEKEKLPYITAERFSEICSDAGINDFERQLGLSRYFHDLGIFLHFQNNSRLGHYIFLQNKWVTDAVYKILDDEIIETEQKGQFNKNDLPRIWSESIFARRRDELLELMLEFKLCYQVQNTDQYICPQLLSSDKPEYEQGTGIPLQLKYVYDFMPKGLFYRLIVRLHHYIAEGQSLVWGSGVVLDRQGARAEILESLDRREISVSVTGDRALYLTTIINEAMDTLHHPFGNKLKVKVLIPCICKECRATSEPHFYDRASLDKRKDKGIVAIQCDNSFDTVNVKELLEGVIENAGNSNKSDEKSSAVKKRIFISYSRHDTEQKDTLLKHLQSFRDRTVTWNDRDILPGEDWDDRIKYALKEADIVLYLVSHNSIATPYIQGDELPLVEDRCKAGECVLIPVIIDFCSWTNLDFAKKNVLPDKGVPVADIKYWINQNEAWLNVVKGIERVVNQN